MMRKRWISLVLIVVFICGTMLTGCGGTSHGKAKDQAETYILSTLTAPGYGDEWKIIGLARGEAEVEEGFFDRYYQSVEAVVKQKDGVLSDRKYTEYSRVILALTAIGKDPTNVAGYNLVNALGDFEKVKMQGINGPIFALIALDSGDYGTAAQRETLIQYILSQQLKDGGFGLAGGDSNGDLTAMAIQALAPYVEERDDVRTCVDFALEYIATCERDSAECLSQIIVALTAMGVDATEDVNLLLTYACADGGFCHELSADGTATAGDAMATEQSYYALVAFDREQNGKTALYDMK